MAPRNGTKIRDKQLIALLNQGIELELAACLQFYYQSLRLTGRENLSLRHRLEEESEAELGHARTLARRVVALGGEPSRTVPPFEIGETPEEMIRLDLEREERAIALYRKIVEQLRHKRGYELVYYEVLKILSDELEDREDFQALAS
jgi:bacterioferritin